MLDGARVDLVLSDMAPNMSGVTSVDRARALYLAELARDFAQDWLRPGGDFLVKLFHGPGFDDYIRQLRPHYEKVVVRKPRASRARSPSTKRPWPGLGSSSSCARTISSTPGCCCASRRAPASE